MRSIPCILTIILALLLAAPGAALHCNGAITTLATSGGTVYLDDRSDAAGDIDHWIYMESNGIEGLQSGTPCTFLGCDDGIPIIETHDPCRHDDPDLLLI